MNACGVYFGLGFDRGGAVCVRPAGHPEVCDDGIGHSDGIHPTYPEGETPRPTPVVWSEP